MPRVSSPEGHYGDNDCLQTKLMEQWTCPPRPRASFHHLHFTTADISERRARHYPVGADPRSVNLPRRSRSLLGPRGRPASSGKVLKGESPPLSNLLSSVVFLLLEPASASFTSADSWPRLGGRGVFVVTQARFREKDYIGRGRRLAGCHGYSSGPRCIDDPFHNPETLSP